MIKVHLYPDPSHGGEPIHLECKPGQSLMQAAIRANVEGIEAECGGSLTCATCHVYVREPWLDKLPRRSIDEDGMLDFAASPRRANSRLSCQIILDDSLEGLAVDIPPTQY